MTKKNKWWLILVYAVVSILLIATAVSCFVQVTRKPDIVEPHSYFISIDNQADYDLCDKENETEKYNKINQAFNNSFKESLLTSLFSGRLFSSSRIDPEKPKTYSGYKLKLFFEQPQKIKLNGKIYNPPTNTATSITYQEIYIDIPQDKGYTTHYLYYFYEYTDSNDVVKSSYYRQSFLANFDALYDLLSE